MKKINYKNLDLDLFYEKLDNGLYEVKAQIETKSENDDGDEENSTDTTTFIVYKNKVVTMK